MTTKSKLKVTEEGFNEMPAKAIIQGVVLGWDLTPVDLKHKNYWENAEDTIVVATKPDMTAFEAVQMMVALNGLGADEVHALKEDDGRIIIRMWWD